MIMIPAPNVIYVFIDASNLWEALKAKGKFLDFDKTIKHIKESVTGTSIKAFYYTAYPAEGTRNYSMDGKHKFFTLDLFGKSFLLQFLVFGCDFVRRRKMVLAVQPVRRRTILLAFLVSRENQKFRHEMTFRRGLFLKKGLGFAVIKKELKRISVVGEQGEAIEEKGNMDVEITIDALHHLKKYDTAVFFTGDSDFLALITYLKSHGKNVFVFSSKNNVSQELRTSADGYTDILMVESIWGKELKHRAELDKERT